jgi:surfeit locus 1 family protein
LTLRRVGSVRAARRPAARILLGLPGALFFAVFLALGTWQVKRLSWKLDLIERVDRRVHAAPIAAPGVAQWPQVNAANDEYRHVRVTGVFMNDHETLVQAATALGSGFWVLTPLRRSDDGSTVLVNRGFVTPEQRERSTRSTGEPKGPTSVAGLLRLTEPGGGFLRKNDPAAGHWYSRDVQAIAKAQGLAEAAPYFIDAEASAPAPVGGLTVVAFPNNHLVYAITWYTLALMVAGAAVFVVRDDRRRRRGQTDNGADAAPQD